MGSQQVSAVVVFKGHNSECDLQQYIILFDVSWLMYVVFLVHMEKEESKVNIVPISCFKLVFLRKAIMGCELSNILLKTIVDVQYVPVFLYYFLYVWQH